MINEKLSVKSIRPSFQNKVCLLIEIILKGSSKFPEKLIIRDGKTPRKLEIDFFLWKGNRQFNISLSLFWYHMLTLSICILEAISSFLLLKLKYPFPKKKIELAYSVCSYMYLYEYLLLLLLLLSGYSAKPWGITPRVHVVRCADKNSLCSGGWLKTLGKIGACATCD